MATDINLFLAFGAGFLSFISPCTLPLYPAFISYITGMSLDDLKSDSKRMSRSGMLHTLFFLIGFSIIFIVLGFATSFVGTFFIENQEILRQVGAIFMVLFGLMIAGVFTPKFLMGEKKLQFKNRPSGYFGSALIGLAFAAGWTPCSGPIIGVIMGLVCDKSRIRHSVYADVCVWFRDSVLCSVVLYYTSWLDSKIQRTDYENRRRQS